MFLQSLLLGFGDSESDANVLNPPSFCIAFSLRVLSRGLSSYLQTGAPECTTWWWRWRFTSGASFQQIHQEHPSPVPGAGDSRAVTGQSRGPLWYCWSLQGQILSLASRVADSGPETRKFQHGVHHWPPVSHRAEAAGSASPKSLTFPLIPTCQVRLAQSGLVE